MIAAVPTPTPRPGQPRTESRPGRLRLVPTAPQQTRWSTDWPPGLEKKLPTLRRHSAILIGPISLTLLGLMAAGNLSTTIARGNGLHGLLIWLAWSALVLRLIWKIFDWWVGYIVVTSDRIIVVSGILRRKITAIWLAQVTAVEVKRRISSRFFGYGEFVFHSQCPALVALDYVPFPEQVEMELKDLVFPGPWYDLDAQDDSVGNSGSPDED
jgi:hypothetical protein